MNNSTISLEFMNGQNIVKRVDNYSGARLTAKKIAELCSEVGASSVWVNHEQVRRQRMTGRYMGLNIKSQKWSVDALGIASKGCFFTRCS